MVNNPYDVSSISSDIDAVRFIEQRREMLQRVSNLVNAVQRLTSSLEVLMYSSGSNAAIADKTFGLLGYLDDQQKNLSTAKIEIRLEALDNGVRDQLSKILASLHDKKNMKKSIAGQQDSVQDPFEVVSEFRRKVRLSMAYRLLLVERGADVRPINLDVAPELISACMKQLEHQEAFYQAKLVDDMQQFHDEVVSLMKSKSLTSRLKAALKEAALQIKQGVASMKSNKSIDVLSELLDLGEFAAILDDGGQAIVHEGGGGKDVMLDDVKQSGDATKGFFGTLNTWLNSPRDVSWKEAKKNK